MPDPSSDSAGVPWQGRTLPDPGFAGDDGTADPALDAALADYDAAAPPAGHAGAAPYDVTRHLAAHERVLTALARARLLVPVVAVLDEVAEGRGGLAAEKSTDMALVTVRAPDGQPAVPAFSSLDRLAAWRPDARPVPAEAARVALSAVAEGATRLVLDPAGPVPYVVERAPLWALAQGRAWVAPHESAEIRAAVTAALTGLASVRAAYVATRPPSTLRLTLVLAPGLDRAQLEALASQVSGRIGDDAGAAERLDGVALTMATEATVPPDAGARLPLAG